MRRTMGLFLCVCLATAMVADTGWALTNGDSAPPIRAKAIKGQLPGLGGGHVTVVEFWATWCGPCRKTIPHMTQLQQYFRPHGVSFVGITRESEAVARPFMEEMGAKMEYTVAVDSRDATSNAYQGGFGVNTIPHAYVVDQKGRIVWHGHPGKSEMVNILIALTGGRAAHAENAGAQGESGAGDAAPSGPSSQSDESVSGRNVDDAEWGDRAFDEE